MKKGAGDVRELVVSGAISITSQRRCVTMEWFAGGLLVLFGMVDGSGGVCEAVIFKHGQYVQFN